MLNLVNWNLHPRHTRWLQLSLNWKGVDSVNVTTLQTGHSAVGELSIKSWIVSQLLILSITRVKKCSLEEKTELLDFWALILASTILMFIFLKCIRPLKKNLKTFEDTTIILFFKFLVCISTLNVKNNIISNIKKSHQYLKMGNVMFSHVILLKLIIIFSDKSKICNCSLSVSLLTSALSISISASSSFGSFSKKEHAERTFPFDISLIAEFNRSISNGILKYKSFFKIWLF